MVKKADQFIVGERPSLPHSAGFGRRFFNHQTIQVKHANDEVEVISDRCQSNPGADRPLAFRADFLAAFGEGATIEANSP